MERDESNGRFVAKTRHSELRGLTRIAIAIDSGFAIFMKSMSTLPSPVPVAGLGPIRQDTGFGPRGTLKDGDVRRSRR